MAYNCNSIYTLLFLFDLTQIYFSKKTKNSSLFLFFFLPGKLKFISLPPLIIFYLLPCTQLLISGVVFKRKNLSGKDMVGEIWVEKGSQLILLITVSKGNTYTQMKNLNRKLANTFWLEFN